MTAKPRPLCAVGVECYRGLCEVFGLTSACAVVRVQQVTVATGAIEASDVVVTEVVAEQVLIGAVAALVHIWTKTDETQRPKRQNAPPSRRHRGLPSVGGATLIRPHPHTNWEQGVDR